MPGTDSGNPPNNHTSDGSSQHNDSQQQDDLWVKFAECDISFAVDTSGSTAYGALDCEKEVITKISSQLDNNARSKVRVLPWNTSTEPISYLSQMPLLRSYGGTVPSSLPRDPACRDCLQSSTLWVLLTDGEIDRGEIQSFSNNLAQYGLHGTACITIVCGTIEVLPKDCDISVGLSVFAAVPDCLFLYVDETNGTTYILQCSGRFTQILELQGRKNPTIDGNVHWTDLPTMSWEGLACVSIPKPKHLSRDDIALQGGLIINVEDLWSGHITDSATVDRIFENEDNLKALLLTAQTRDRTESFQAWIKPYLDPSKSPIVKLKDDGGMAMKTIKTMLEEIQSEASPQRKAQLQEQLFHVRSASLNSYNEDFRQESRRETRRRSSGGRALRRSDAVVCNTATALNPLDGGDSSSDESDYEFRDSAASGSSNRPNGGRRGAKQPLCIPNFVKNRPGDTFEGVCLMCNGKNTNITIFLRKPPSSIKTAGFPAVGSRSRLAFPMAMGNFPETDILSTYVCCDFCAYYLVQNGKTPTSDEIVCALPLVRYRINEPAYKKQLLEAFERRFDEQDQMLLLIAVAVNKAERIPDSSDTKQVRAAISWLVQNLCEELECTRFVQFGDATHEALQPVLTVEKTILAAIGYRDAYSDWEGVLKYPPEGFVAIMLSVTYLKTLPHEASRTRLLIWHRFLYHITENYHDYMTKNGPVLGHIAMAQLLQQRRNSTTPKPTAVARNSRRSIRDITRSVLTDRLAKPHLSVSLDMIAGTPLLQANDVSVLKKLKSEFDWIDSSAGRYSLAVFLHFLARKTGKTLLDQPISLFAALKKTVVLERIFSSPDTVDAQLTKSLVKELPPLLEPA